jgi:predicted nuclease of predicted toxin-antitoxin system
LTFKIDENLPVEAALVLRTAGFAADTVDDERLSGADDQIIAERVQHERRILVTLDLDFSNIQTYPPKQYAGLIILRLQRQDKTTVLAYVQRMTALLRDRCPTGELWIVQHDRIRVRQGS